MAASILALLPCSPVSLLGLAAGVWSLIVLNRRNVTAAFEAQKHIPAAARGPDRFPGSPSNGPGAPSTDRRRSRVQSAARAVLIVASLAWLATVGELISFLISQTNRSEVRLDIGYSAFIVAVVYGLIIYGSLNGFGLKSRRLAAAAAGLLATLGLWHFILLAVELNAGEFSPVLRLLMMVWPRVRVMSVVGLLAVPVGLWSLKLLCSQEAKDVFRDAAESVPRRDGRPARALAIIALCAVVSWVGVGAAMALRRDRPARISRPARAALGAGA